jgi:glycosyltransferase involved in cell wall biosynthesis
VDKNEKKTLLIVNNNMDLGGVQRALVNLLHAVGDKYAITLFLFSNTGGYKNEIPGSVRVMEAAWPLKLLGISQKEAKSQGLLSYLVRGALSAIAKIGNNHGPIGVLVRSHPIVKNYDVAISYLHNIEGHLLYGGCNDFVLRRVEAHKKISYLHCDFLQCGGNTPYTRHMMKKFHRIAAVSEGCRTQFLEAMPDLELQTFCVANCHQIQEYRSKALEEPLMYDHDHIHIVTVARIDAGKGHLRTLDVMEQLMREGYNIQWHLVGDGVLEASLKEQVAKRSLEEQVLFHGNQTNPYRYIKHAHLFLLPSHHEAAPMVFMEAKALGVPVLTTATLSAREMILEGKEGFICENSEEGIYQGLKDLMVYPQKLFDCRAYLQDQVYSNQQAMDQFDRLVM